MFKAVNEISTSKKEKEKNGVNANISTHARTHTSTHTHTVCNSIVIIAKLSNNQIVSNRCIVEMMKISY